MESWVSRSVFLASVLLLVAERAPLTVAQKNVVCYYSSWATYRPGFGQFNVEDIDPFLCTHVIYAFIGLNSDGTVRIMDPWNDLDNGAFRRFTNLRAKNPNLKTLVAIGGWNEGSAVFSQVAGNSALRATFVNSAYSFIKQYGFSGLDVDWEYPAQRGGATADRNNFVLMLRDLRAKFQAENLMLSIAVSASIYAVSGSYNVPEIVKYVDFVNLMTYDYHGSWESTTGIHSPLYPSSIDKDLTINGDATVKYWLQQGAPPTKLLMGAPMYGRSYTLFDVNSPGLGAVTRGPGIPGPFTQESGFLGFNEICQQQSKGTWNLNWATQQKVPFAFSGNQWVGYDDVRSVTIKAEYVKMQGLGGMLVWGVETDDLNNLCGKGKMPLITAIKTALNTPGVSADAYPATQGPWKPSTVNYFSSGSSSSSSTKAPSTTSTTTRAPTTTTRTPTTTTQAPVTTTQAPVTTTRAPVTTTRAPATTQAPVTTTTTRAPITTTTTVAPPSGTFTCPKVGYFRDPSNCNVYYYCQDNMKGGFNTIRQTCPTGLAYDPTRQICDWRYNVPGC